MTLELLFSDSRVSHLLSFLSKINSQLASDKSISVSVMRHTLESTDQLWREIQSQGQVMRLLEAPKAVLSQDLLVSSNRVRCLQGLRVSQMSSVSCCSNDF